jgi:hypothetical protein
VLVSAAGAIGLLVTSLPLVAGELIASLLPALVPIIETLAFAFKPAPLVGKWPMLSATWGDPGRTARHHSALMDAFSELIACCRYCPI